MAVGDKKENENGGYEFPYHIPSNKTAWEKFSTAIWNPSTKEFCGRTGKSWAQLLIFYTLFYIVLAALFAICMQGLFATLDDKVPKWQLDSSLIGTNPGMGFRPISSRTEEGSLIWYNTGNASTITKWVHLLDEFLEGYNGSQVGGNQVNCNAQKAPGPDQVCVLELQDFGPCSPEKQYGYNSSSPCVFLKLNRIFGWVPEYYNNTSELPEEMPEDLRSHILKLGSLSSSGKSDESLNQIWISCRGEYPADREHVNPNFGYYPTRGFPGYFYPYMNQEKYLSPLVAVQVVNPTSNVLINIECRAWAKNINYRGGDRQREGSIHFELMRDEPILSSNSNA